MSHAETLGSLAAILSQYCSTRRPMILGGPARTARPLRPTASEGIAGALTNAAVTCSSPTAPDSAVHSVQRPRRRSSFRTEIGLPHLERRQSNGLGGQP